MATWNLGSCATEMFNVVDNIPTAMSGATLLGIIDRKRLYMETFLGVSIGSTGIAEQYQGALFNLAISDLMSAMNIQGADFSYSIGELRVDKNKGSGILASAENFHSQGMAMLHQLKGRFTFFKALG